MSRIFPGRSTVARLCAVMAAVLLVLAPASLGQAATGRQASGPPSRLAHTGDGLVRGTDEAGTVAFRGIPFARPPVGTLRWQPPQPPAPWPGVRDASAYGQACAQGPTELTPSTGNEDCLSLNVWVPPRPPGAPGRPMPVMVWLHGGGFVAGAGSDDSGAALARTGHVIVVSVNYRLGPLGFLSLPGDPAEGTTANLGLLDQTAALHWVQDNIAAFGGNPGNVTLFGESAGAESVCADLVSPLAQGLFQKAVMESGPCSRAFPTQAAMEQRSEKFASAVGCPQGPSQMACLRSRTTSELLAGAAESLNSLENGANAWAPSVAGPVLPGQPAAGLAAGTFQRVPVLEGTNSDEGTFFTALSLDLKGVTLTAAQYTGVVTELFGNRAAAVLSEYPAGGYPDPEAALAAIETDSSFAASTVATSDLLAKYTTVFQYQFADADAPSVIPAVARPLGATHESEIQYLFGDPATAFSPGQARLSRRMQNCWSTFARTGSPGNCTGGAWPEFEPDSAGVENFTPGDPGSVPFLTQHHVQFWTDLLSGS